MSSWRPRQLTDPHAAGEDARRGIAPAAGEDARRGNAFNIFGRRVSAGGKRQHGKRGMGPPRNGINDQINSEVSDKDKASTVHTQPNPETDFEKWQERRISKSQLFEELRNQSLSPDEIAAVWDKYARYRIDRRSAQGWIWMFTGGAMGLVSCVLTILDFLPELRGVFMYGLTTLAICMALYGCYLVMEKPDDEEA